MGFRLDDIDHCALIAADSAGLADAAEGNLDARVESCPGWTVADLVRHVHEVHAFWVQIVERGLTDHEQAEPIVEPRPDALVEDFRAGAHKLVEVLRATDPATPVWTWAPQQDVGFVTRHQVQEIAIHRWDAEHAAGRDFDIDPAGAADAIDEFLRVSLRSNPDTPLDQAVVLVADGTNAAWTVSADSSGMATARRGAGDAPNQVIGPPGDLLLWLYGRRATSALAVSGDPAVVERLRAHAATG